MQNKKILIVEDDIKTCELLEKLLREHFSKGLSVDVVIVVTLAAARSRVANNSIALILLDGELPDSTDPFETIKFIKEVAPCPVVLCTGFNDAALIAAAREQGMVDYFIKGQSADVLFHTVGRAINFDQRREVPASIALPCETKAIASVTRHYSLRGTLLRATPVVLGILALLDLGGRLWSGVVMHDKAVIDAETMQRKIELAQEGLTRHDSDFKEVKSGIHQIQESVHTLDIKVERGAQDRQDIRDMIRMLIERGGFDASRMPRK